MKKLFCLALFALTLLESRAAWLASRTNIYSAARTMAGEFVRTNAVYKGVSLIGAGVSGHIGTFGNFTFTNNVSIIGDFTAPNANISAFAINSTYGNFTGTSFSTADIAGGSEGGGFIAATGAGAFGSDTTFFPNGAIAWDVNGRFSTTSIGTHATNFNTIVANTIGATNTTDKTEVWNIKGTSGTLQFFFRDGYKGGAVGAIALWTNTVSTVGGDYIVGPNCAIQISSGVGTTLSRRVF